MNLKNLLFGVSMKDLLMTPSDDGGRDVEAESELPLLKEFGDLFDHCDTDQMAGLVAGSYYMLWYLHAREKKLEAIEAEMTFNEDQ